MLDLENSIPSSEHGRKLTLNNLQKIADRLFQTINAVLVGITPGQPPPRLPIQTDYQGGFIIIEAIDSSLWAVSSNEPTVINALRHRFRNTKQVL